MGRCISLKRCALCRRKKSEHLFNLRGGNRIGRQAYCRICMSKHVRAYEKSNWDEIRIRKRIWQRRHRKQIRAKKRLRDSKNRPAINARQRIRRAQNRDRYREYDLKRSFGITLIQYNTMRTSQRYRCAICRIHEEKLDRSLAIDHNHKTEDIRGLLCGRCNRGLGHFSDDPSIVIRAAAYLRGIAIIKKESV